MKIHSINLYNTYSNLSFASKNKPTCGQNIVTNVPKDKSKMDDRVVYLIGIDGTLKRYDNRQKASESIGIEVNKINSQLLHVRTPYKGYTFVRGNDITCKNENNEYVFDVDKLNEAHRKINDRALYVVDEDNNAVRFDSIKDASETLDIGEDTIYRYLRVQPKEPRRYIFIKANELEHFDKEGNFVVDDIKDYLAENKIRRVETQSLSELIKNVEGDSSSAREIVRQKPVIKESSEYEDIRKMSELVSADSLSDSQKPKQALKGFWEYRDIRKMAALVE